ncbi:MAG: DUF4197 domain-containing protein [Saprospiraceae bacterium]|nr:DUF4197 domain-containing protein [Saprospiraceae bacterium]
MKKHNIFLLLLLAFGFTTANAQLGNMLNKAKNQVMGVKEDNTSLGLKEALNEGVKAAVNTLAVENGYFGSPYKILIPAEAMTVINKVSKIPGFGDVEEKLVAKMNQAAEIAAKKATPIFVDAIKQMTVKDASSILFGEKNAATTYLNKTSRQPLYDTFIPVIQSSLDEVNARTYWASVVEAYNKIPFIKKLNPALDDHVNQKALDGLFSLIEVKEAGIREDVGQRTSPLLKEVFSKLDK